MKLRMSYFVLCITSLLMHSAAQWVSQPLPTVDKELVNKFRLALDAVFGMGIRMQAVFQGEKNENFLVSPISAATIVGQLLLGAEGEFQEQLVELLSLPDSHLYKNEIFNCYGKNKNESYSLPYSTLHIQLSLLLKALESGPNANKQFILKNKNAIFYDKRIKLKELFRKNLKNLYAAQNLQVDFNDNPNSAQKTMNDWASRNTNGLIKTILPQPPPRSTNAVLANAVYFLAEWETPFSDELNSKGFFNVTPTKRVEVTYMAGFIEQIFYSESEEYRILGLPYKNEELGMYIILPKPENKHKYDLKSFSANLKVNEVLATIARGRRRDVVVKMPKMTVSSSFSLLDELKKYRVFKKQDVEVKVTSRDNAVDQLEDKVGVFNNFTTDMDPDVYLTNAAVNRTLRLGDIVQQVVITINEKGTEAAAISASTMDYMGGSKNFVVDRPFLFFIRHEATSASLFWGTITNPTA